MGKSTRFRFFLDGASYELSVIKRRWGVWELFCCRGSDLPQQHVAIVDSVHAGWTLTERALKGNTTRLTARDQWLEAA